MLSSVSPRVLGKATTKGQYLHDRGIDPFLKPIFPIFGILGLKSFRTFESFLRGVFC